MKTTELKNRLSDFYASVDGRAGMLEEIHAERLNCKRGCSACCVDDVTVFEIEAEVIMQNQSDLLKYQEPHEAGMCAFLGKDGECRIYSDRPYVCRTQGLPLRWFDQVEGQFVEFRDICSLNEDGEPVESIPERDCWTIGEFEGKLAELQKRFGTGKSTRVKLRDLFEVIR